MIESLGSLEGKYEIIENIGEGGMGSVFKVRHKILDEIRVVKMMRSHLVHEDDSKERFFREARIAAKARHRNIAQIFDFSVDEGVAFIIMEYIDGVTLQNVLANRGKLSIPLALEVAQQSLHALSFVHRLGIIHRDISPDNLMLTADSDGNPRIKLIDLGLAKFTEADSGLTKGGVFLGKLRYASPEQFQTLQGVELGPWSDVYSFGLVLYELLTGHYPIRGRNLAEMMVGHVTEPPMAFSESDPQGSIPDELRQIVLRSLAKRSNQRFADGHEFRKAVLTIQEKFPCGEAEREEADLARTVSRRSPGEAGVHSSDKGRLDGAFRVDESSAGKSSVPTEEMPSRPDSPSSGQQRPDTADSAPLKEIEPPPRSPLERTVQRKTPPPIELATEDHSEAEIEERAEEGLATSERRSRPAERITIPEPAPVPEIKRTVEPPTIPIEQRRQDRIVHVQPEGPESVGWRAKTEPRTRLIVGAVIVAVAVLVTAVAMRWIPFPFIHDGDEIPGVSEVVGTLVVNAVPWARITEIQDGEGKQVEVGDARFTPAVITLPPGSYHIVVRHDDFGERTIDATVIQGETSAHLVPFAEIDEDDLLTSLRVLE